MNALPRVFLNAKEENEIKQGFPWVFDNEIACVKIDGTAPGGQHTVTQTSLAESTVADGSAVEVYSKAGLYLGTGVINRKSKITVRIMSRERGTPLDRQFFYRRIEDALAIRFMYFSKHDSYRLVFAEADLLPGLIVERYCDVSGRVFLVVQFLALAAEVFRQDIIEVLRDICKPAGIYERSDAAVREKEGLKQESGWIGAEFDPVITIKENGVEISVDLANGQKTGYFLDQKFNRAVVGQLAGGKRVLDTFSHTGAFGLNAAAAGAKEVISVDISPEAIENVKVNIERNKAGKVMKAVCADVFDVLRKYDDAGEKFDLIVLDPPAFTKSAKLIDKAYSGYKEINLRALRLLNAGGILVTCSCSYFFDEHTFYGMLMHAAVDAHRTVQILEKRGAAPDHPVLSGYPKSGYLKCAIVRVL